MRTRRLTAASPARALAEGGLIATVLLLATAAVTPIEPVNALWASLGIGRIAGISAGAVVASRARPPEGSSRHRLRLEAEIVGAGVIGGLLVSFAAIAVANLWRPGLDIRHGGPGR